VFTENLAPVNHAFGALVGLFSLNAGMIVLGIASLHRSQPVAALAIAAGVLGALGLLLFFTDALSVPRGYTERLADYPGKLSLHSSTVSSGRLR
jgi:hypothetical protein